MESIDHPPRIENDPRAGSLQERIVRASVRSRIFGTGDIAPRVGRFTLLEVVGEGSMGAVWAAYDPDLDRRVALKLLHASDDDVSGDERVLREARAMASINHPNVAHVYEVGVFEGRIFIAMEFIAGTTLRQWQREPSRQHTEIVEAYLQAGRGLAAAHEVGIVHRDFKPDNALVDARTRVRVVDFGLAHVGLTMEATDGDGDDSPSGGTRTSTRRRAGTPAYRAPEQFRGEPIDARADQFAFCVALFEALSGERPFVGGSSVELFEATQGGEVRRDRLPSSVSAAVRDALVRGLRPDPADRYPTMQALLTDLARDSARARRVWFATGGIVVALGGAMVLGRALAPATAEPCPDPSDKLRGLWDDDRRALANAALERVAPSFAAHTWSLVEPVLDAYAAQWVAAHLDACRATHVRNEQSEARLDLRMACLEGRRRALGAMVSTLADADATVAENAIKASKSLPPIDRCADPKYVAATDPLPDDPDTAKAVSMALDQVAHARALYIAGRFAAAKQLAAQALADAQELGYAPLVARAQHALGAAMAALGDVQEAEPRLRGAYAEARRAGLDEVGAEAAVDLGYLLARHTVRRGEAKIWVKVGQTEAEILGDVRLQAASRNAHGVAAILGEEREEALAAFEDAVALLEGTPISADHLSYRGNLGRVIRHQGRIEESAAILQQVYRDGEALLGPNHPALVAYIDALSEPWGVLDRYKEMEPLLEQALTITLRARGEAHPDTARILSQLGQCQLRQGRLDDARATLERAVAASSAAAERGAQVGGTGLRELAQVHLALGNSDLAIELMQRNIEAQDRWMGPGSRDAAVARGELAGILEALDQHREALPHLDDSLRIFEELLGPDHLDVSGALQYRAEAYVALGRADEAIQDLDRALAIRERALGPSSHKVADILYTLAKARFSQRQYTAALEAAERALSLVDGHEGFLPHEVAGLKFLLAKILIASGAKHRSRAIELAEEALLALRAGPPAAQPEARAVETWLGQTRSP